MFNYHWFIGNLVNLSAPNLNDVMSVAIRFIVKEAKSTNHVVRGEFFVTIWISDVIWLTKKPDLKARLCSLWTCHKGLLAAMDFGSDNEFRRLKCDIVTVISNWDNFSTQ